MLRSMTGFGRFFLKSKKGDFTVEIQSVNRRFLESVVFMPKEFLSFEIDIKKAILKKVFRGQVTFRLNYQPSKENIADFLPNVEFLASLKEGWEKIIDQIGLNKRDVNLSFLAQQLKSFSNVEEKPLDEEKSIVLDCLSKAIDELIKTKENEGVVLFADMKNRLFNIKELLKEIENNKKNSVQIYEEKLKERIASFLEDNECDERILKEIAIFAEKVDITEEIVRLKSHIDHFLRLENSKDIVGRKMDFILQEMGREVNTIGSKAMDKDIAKFVIEIKSELEKIREQVQNIE